MNTKLTAPWTSHTYAVVDVEGNGQQPPDLVELAIVPIVEGKIGPPLQWLVKPSWPILPTARRIHKISDAMVADQPPLAQVADDILAALDGQVFVAHNAHVDLGVLTRQLPMPHPPHVIDTLKLARLLAPGQVSYRLGHLIEAFHLADASDGLSSDMAPHRAAYDALMCARLLTSLAESAGNPPLLDLSNTADKSSRTPGHIDAASIF